MKLRHITFSQWSIKHQIFLILFLPALLVSIVGGSLLYQYELNNLLDKMRLQHKVKFNILLAGALEATIAEDILLLESLFSRANKYDEDLYRITVRDEYARLLFSWQATTNTSSVIEKKFVDVFELEGENFGQLEITWNMQKIHSNIQKQLLIEHLFLTTGLLTLVLIIMVFLHRLVINPLRLVNHQLHAIAAGDRKSRLSVSSSKELARVSDSVNELSSVLEVHEKEVDANISRYKETEETLRQAHQQEEIARQKSDEILKAKSEFLAVISHEIRTPINGILGMAQLLMDSELTNQQREHLDTLLFSGNSLLYIVNDILDFSKIEAGKLVLDPVAFDLKNTIQEACRILRVTAQEKGLSLDFEYTAECPQWLIGDAGRIRQVLLNLLSNSVKFTKQGYVWLQITGVKKPENKALIHIIVEDSGIGIAQEAQSTLFDAFTQADASMSRRFGGTGLGLAICRKLITQMGGNIKLESTPGQGTRFFVDLLLPLAEIPSQIDQHKAPPPLLTNNSVSPTPITNKIATQQSNIHVLLVEDNIINQTVMTAMLKKLGLKPIVASNGIEALKCLEKHQFDLILMDCQMPEMDGFEATRIIRTREKNYRTPIIAVTANIHTEDRNRCSDSGMDDFISKPLSLETLTNVLQQWTNKPSDKFDCNLYLSTRELG